MNAYTRFAAGVLFPLHELLKRHSTRAVKRQMEHSQWYSPEQLRALQLRRLQHGKLFPYLMNGRLLDNPDDRIS